MKLYQDDRPHPIPGMVSNPEWEVALTRRAELYLEDRARREDPEREPNNFHIALGAIGFFIVAASLFKAVMS